VGLHHLQNQNFIGARNKLQSGLEKLEATQRQSVYQPPIALSSFIQDSRQALETLISLGPERLDAFPQDLMPHLAID
jgi:hypothetical protein